MQRTLDISYDQLIIGISKSALHFSLENNIPIIFLRNNKPSRYEIREDDYNVELYNKLCFDAGLKSLILFSGLLFSVRIEDNDTVIATTISNILIRIKYKELFIADDYKLEGMPPIVGKTSTKNEVTDFFDLNNGGLKDPKDLSIKDNVIKQIIFYKRNGYKSCKDCYTLSIIDDKNIEDFQCSQTYIKIKLTSLFKENGFIKPKLLSRDRVIKPLGKNIYEDLPTNIKLL